MKLLLFRKTGTATQTLGYFECPDGTTYPSLELPWKNNQKRVSCIPTGIYRMVRHTSPKFGPCYWLQDVPNRSEILIHPANFVRQLLGCIAPGLTHADIDGDGNLDVTSSKIAMGKLLEWQFTEIEIFG
jgi:hypothetical protein